GVAERQDVVESRIASIKVVGVNALDILHANRICAVLQAKHIVEAVTQVDENPIDGARKRQVIVGWSGIGRNHVFDVREVQIGKKEPTDVDGIGAVPKINHAIVQARGAAQHEIVRSRQGGQRAKAGSKVNGRAAAPAVNEVEYGLRADYRIALDEPQ